MSDAEPSGAFSAFLDSLKERERREARARSTVSRGYTREQIEALEVLSEHAALAQDNLLLFRRTWDRAERLEQDPGAVLNYAQDAEAALKFRRGLTEQLRILLRHLDYWLAIDEEDHYLASVHKRLQSLYSRIRRDTEPNTGTLDELGQLLSDISEIVEERILGLGRPQ